MVELLNKMRSITWQGSALKLDVNCAECGRLVDNLLWFKDEFKAGGHVHRARFCGPVCALNYSESPTGLPKLVAGLKSE